MRSTQYTQSNFYGSSLSTTWDSDYSMCEAGQDFIIQIAPFGCTPAVVRSDLLEEQNVPIFCQLAATKINPLIDVEAIDYISFAGKYPKEISGIGFHPAKAALGVKEQIGMPVLDNIGYTVIVLKKQENASAMPKYIEGNLTATIKYDIKNAYGIGAATFFLPELEDSDWEQNKALYSFWKGNGYLKAEAITDTGATIGIYDGTRRISQIKLEKGKTSNEIYLPGFDCLAGLKIRLDSFENPATRARLEINGDIVEVAENEKFLENRCQVKNIEKRGLVEEVTIRCNEDEKSKTFSLIISPRVELKIDEVKNTYEIGQKLFASNDGKKNIYLGFIGTRGNTGKKEDLYVRFVETPTNTEMLSSSELAKVAKYDSYFTIGSKGSLVNKISMGVLKSLIGGGITAVEAIGNGKFYPIFYYEGNILGLPSTNNNKKISIIGFAGPIDENIAEEKQDKSKIKEYYDSANKDYDVVIDSFPSEIYNKQVLGEEALFNKIELAGKLNQKKTLIELCKEFEEKFPDSNQMSKLFSDVDGVCNDEVKLSSSAIANKDVLINGEVKAINFRGIYEPSLEDYSVDISLSNVKEGCLSDVSLQKEGETCVSDSEFVSLKELYEDYAIFDVDSIKQGTTKEIVGKISELKINLGETRVIGEGNYRIKVNKINLKKSAKVSVLPSIKNAETQANFSFKIGIEQRTIKLSPEKTKERINNLNKSITEWEDKSEKLGNVVKGLKGACLATGTFFTVKNFFSNLGGRGIARQNVMNMKGGINDMCAAAINRDGKWATEGYETLDECFTKQNSFIEEMVDKYEKEQNELNDFIKNIQKNHETTNWFGETRVNDVEFMKDYCPEAKQDIEKNLAGYGEVKVKEGVTESASEIMSMLGKDCEHVTIEQLRSLQLNSRLGDIDFVKEQLNTDLISVYNNNEEASEKRRQEELMKENPALEGVTYSVVKAEKSIEINYGGGKVVDGNVYEALNTGALVQKINYKGHDFLVELEDKKSSNNERGVKNVHLEGGDLLTKPDCNIYQDEKLCKIADEVKQQITFKEYDETSYKNKYTSSSSDPQNVVVKFYETEPYKGLPAIVPFDCTNGWYASIKQTLPILGNVGSYDKSGRVTSFYLCNVGKNGKEEDKGGNDICEMINTGTGMPYNQFPGLDASKSAKLVQDAINAIERTSRNYKSGVSGNMRIGNCNAKVGSPAVDIPDMQCQNFMSPKDCQILFNVCDPVICPSSRCNFGGAYPVKDVIQSGIIGSLALCLPNVREGIYIPVCLSGIKAGLDGWISILRSHRDCLQESLDSGKMIGICDEIYSLHACNFFWKQGLPIANMVLPKILEWATGQNVRGGGEYLGVANAWQNAQNSIDYFTDYYAANAYKAFKARTSEDIGDAVCNNFVSVTYPDGGNILDALTDPDSPPQFHGRFDEIPFTTATNPPVSQYKVYYHIYAGKDSRAYYNVYLKGGSDSSYYQDTSNRRVVASGYIATGEYASETKDFTAPSGYKELCINVNGQEECDFKEVSTSFAVDWVKDQYVKEQAGETNVKTEKECIAGSSSLYSLINPNIEGAADDVLNPAIYDRGIIRICATESPGKNTDATADARWKMVGYCSDDQKIKCWLDSDSVKNAVQFESTANETLEKVTKNVLEKLKEQGNSFLNFDKEVEEIEKLTAKQIIDRIKEPYLARAFFNNQKAKLLLMRANAYAELTKGLWKEIEEEKTKAEDILEEGEGNDEKETTASTSTTGEICPSYSCNPNTNLYTLGGECQKQIGQEIIKIAQKIKLEKNIDESKIIETDAKNFECLVLMQAMKESCLSHCIYQENEDDAFYCDDNSPNDDVVAGDNDRSVGVMQINLDSHSSMINKAYNYEENLNYGIKNVFIDYAWKLAQREGGSGRYYDCTRKSYSWWELALRYYNGWFPSDCTKGNKNYVEDVLARKKYIEDLFPECGENFEIPINLVTNIDSGIFTDGFDVYLKKKVDNEKIIIGNVDYSRDGKLIIKDIKEIIYIINNLKNDAGKITSLIPMTNALSLCNQILLIKKPDVFFKNGKIVVEQIPDSGGVSSCDVFN